MTSGINCCFPAANLAPWIAVGSNTVFTWTTDRLEPVGWGILLLTQRQNLIAHISHACSKATSLINIRNAFTISWQWRHELLFNSKVLQPDSHAVCNLIARRRRTNLNLTVVPLYVVLGNSDSLILHLILFAVEFMHLKINYLSACGSMWSPSHPLLLTRTNCPHWMSLYLTHDVLGLCGLSKPHQSFPQAADLDRKKKY